MNNSNEACRAIIDNKDVTVQRVGEVLLEQLVSPGHMGKDETAVLSQHVERILTEQANRLVDVVMKISN